MALNGESGPKDRPGADIQDSSVYESREEYLQKLNHWLEEARAWHEFCAGFPYYMSLQNQTGTNIRHNTWNSVYPTRPAVNNNLPNENVIGM